MKKAIAGIVALAGLATMASAATTIQYQVRPVGGTWSSDITVAPGTQVEFRCLVSFTGGTLSQSDGFGGFYTGPAYGFGGVNSQPTVSNWTAADSIAPFLSTGAPAASSVADFDASGLYGRKAWASGNSGITAANALKAHTNNVVSGVRYLRIAQTPATNWIGVGSANNNVNGASSIPDAQTGPANNANFVAVTQNVEIHRFKITVNGAAARDLQVTTHLGSMFQTSSTATPPLARYVQWHLDTGGATSVPANDYDITIVPAMIHVPTPGAIALLGLGGLVAGRRRR